MEGNVPGAAWLSRLLGRLDPRRGRRADAEGLRAGVARLEPAFATGFVRRDRGWCPICEADAVFSARDAWLRDHLMCDGCASIPRERALVRVLGEQVPDWRARVLHESSPAGASSIKLRRECPGYVASQWWPDRAPGTVHDGVRCENLEALTLADASVDVFVTQDVLEHVLDPDAAFREIARVLRPGGVHVFTTPIYLELAVSEVRARRAGAGVEHLLPPEFHGNPIDPAGALVTVHWGRDVTARIQDACGLSTMRVSFAEAHMGLLGQHLDVLVTRRPA